MVERLEQVHSCAALSRQLRQVRHRPLGTGPGTGPELAYSVSIIGENQIERQADTPPDSVSQTNLEERGDKQNLHKVIFENGGCSCLS